MIHLTQVMKFGGAGRYNRKDGESYCHNGIPLGLHQDGKSFLIEDLTLAGCEFVLEQLRSTKDSGIYSCGLLNQVEHIMALNACGIKIDWEKSFKEVMGQDTMAALNILSQDEYDTVHLQLNDFYREVVKHKKMLVAKFSWT